MDTKNWTTSECKTANFNEGRDSLLSCREMNYVGTQLLERMWTDMSHTKLRILNFMNNY